MEKSYIIPLTGKVRRRYPLAGDENDPIRPIRVCELVSRAIWNEEWAKAKAENPSLIQDDFVAPEDMIFTATNSDEDIDKGICSVEVEASLYFHSKLQEILDDNLENLYTKTGSLSLFTPEYLKEK